MADVSAFFSLVSPHPFDANAFCAKFVFYGFAAAAREALEYSLDEYFEFYKNAMDYILEKNKQGIFLKEMLSVMYLNKMLNNIDSGFMDVRSPG